MVETFTQFEADTVVDEFRQCVIRGRALNTNAPGLLKRILADGFWRRPDKAGKLFKHVEQFIKASPLPGLGSDVETVKRICRFDTEALEMLDKAMQESPRQGLNLDNNVNEVEPRPQGNSRQRALRTLREKRPDLHKQVLAGELTPHRAMVEAGLRDVQISIPADPSKAAVRLARHFQGERRALLIKELESLP